MLTDSKFQVFRQKILISIQTEKYPKHVDSIPRFRDAKNGGQKLITSLKVLVTNALLNELWTIWVKVFKNGPSKTCGRQPVKNLKGYGLLRQTI